MRHLQIILTVCATILLTAGSASAGPGDWLNTSGNWNYTSHAAGTADISQPVQRWRVRAGGGIGSEAMLVFDVDGDNVDEIITASAGKVQCRAMTGELVWESAPNGIDVLAGRADFDGDGVEEIVAIRSEVPATVYLVDSTTGELKYRNAFGEIGRLTTNTLSIGDLNGDGKPDLIVKPDQPYYFMHAIYHDDVEGYKELWNNNLGALGYANVNPPIIADLDGNGTDDIAILQERHLQLLTASDGSPHPRISDVFLSHNFGLIQAVDTDTDGLDELVVVGTTGQDHAVSMIDPQRIGAELVWQRHYVPNEETALIYRASSVGDFDDDGMVEIIVSVYNDIDTELDGPTGTPADYDGVNHPDAWVTLVLDAETGATLAHLQDLVFEEAVFDPATNQPLIFLSQSGSGVPTLDTFSTLTAYQFDGAALTQVAGWPQLARAALVRCIDVHQPTVARPGYNGTGDRACATEADTMAAGREVLFLVDQNNDGLGEELHLLRQTNGSQVAMRTVGTGFRVLANDVVFDTSQPPGLIIDHSDGEVEVWDVSLTTQVQWSITTGARPIGVADLGGSSTHNELLVIFGSGDLGVYDIEGASLTTDPLLVWTYSGGVGQQVRIFDHDGVDQKEMLLHNYTNPLTPILEIRRLDASYNDILIGSAGFQNYGSGLDYVVPANLTGAGNKDLIVMLDDSRNAQADRRRLIGLNGDPATGVLNELWNVPVSHRSLSLRAADLFNGGGDNIEDALVWETNNVLQLMNGVNGAPEAVYPTTESYSRHQILDNLDSDAALEVVTGGYTAIGAWDVSANTQLFREAAQFGCEHCGERFVTCDVDTVSGKDVVVTNGWGEIRAYNAVNGTLLWEKQALAGSIAAIQPLRISLHRPVAGDIDNDGLDEVVFGSDDGFLYVLNAEDGSLLWSYNMLAAPVYVALANIDADSDLEILTAVDDGWVYAIDELYLPATAVRDLELDLNGTTFVNLNDTDYLERVDRIGVGWNEVPSAGSVDYVAWIETELGAQVSDRISVTDASGIIVPTSPLTVGMRYRSAVQPVDAQGAGPIAYSDGFIVVDLSAPSIFDFDVVPNVLTATGQVVNLSARLVDPTGLMAYRLEILNNQSQLVYLHEQPVAGQQHNLVTTWDGRDTNGQYLPRGSYLLSLSASDLTGRSGGNSLRYVTIEWELLTAPTLSSPTEGAIVANASPTFIGVGGSSDIITVMENGNVLCQNVADSSGSFSCDPSLPLAEGPHTVYAKAASSLGDASPDGVPVNFVVDTLAPTPPVIIAPATGNYPLMHNLRPTITGYAYEAGLDIEIMANDGTGDSLLCTAGPTAAPDFAWSCIGSQDFSLGTYELSAVAIDDTGHRSVAGATVHVTLTPPIPPTITDPRSGVYAIDEMSLPTISGEAFDVGVTIEVTATGSQGDQVLCTSQATTADLTWSCLSESSLEAETYSLTAVAIDSLGNRSAPGGAVGIMLSDPTTSTEDGCGCSSGTANLPLFTSWAFLMFLWLAIRRRRERRY